MFVDEELLMPGLRRRPEAWRVWMGFGAAKTTEAPKPEVPVSPPATGALLGAAGELVGMILGMFGIAGPDLSISSCGLFNVVNHHLQDCYNKPRASNVH